jgi:hypothetical protein
LKNLPKYLPCILKSHFLKESPAKSKFFRAGTGEQRSVRCDGCNHLKSLVVRLSPLAVNCEFRLFAGDSQLRKLRKFTFCKRLLKGKSNKATKLVFSKNQKGVTR